MYEADLSSVQGNCKVSKRKKDELQKYKGSRTSKIKNSRLLISNKNVKTLSRSADLVFAKSFDDIFEKISVFEVGEELTKSIFKTLSIYIDRKLADVLDNNDLIPNQYPVEQLDESDGLPVVIIDIDKEFSKNHY